MKQKKKKLKRRRRKREEIAFKIVTSTSTESRLFSRVTLWPAAKNSNFLPFARSGCHPFLFFRRWINRNASFTAAISRPLSPSGIAWSREIATGRANGDSGSRIDVWRREKGIPTISRSITIPLSCRSSLAHRTPCGVFLRLETRRSPSRSVINCRTGPGRGTGN